MEDGALSLSCKAPRSSVSPETLPSTRTRAPCNRTGFGYVASTALTLIVHVPQSSGVFFFLASSFVFLQAPSHWVDLDASQPQTALLGGAKVLNF